MAAIKINVEDNDIVLVVQEQHVAEAAEVWGDPRSYGTEVEVEQWTTEFLRAVEPLMWACQEAVLS